MTSFEKAEIRRLPKKYRPIGAWGYFWYSLLYSIPVIGWICLIYGACSDKKICRRSFARSYFCAFLIAIILTAILVVLFVTKVITPEMIEEITKEVPNEI